MAFDQGLPGASATCCRRRPRSGCSADEGLVLVEPEAVAEEPELKAWVERSRRFVRTLPPK